MHAPTGHAFDFGPCLREGLCNDIGATGYRKRVIGNADFHRLANKSVSRALSKRACTLSPTSAAGPTEHSPKQ